MARHDPAAIDDARTRYEAGEAVLAVSRATGIPRASVYSMAKSRGWKRPRPDGLPDADGERIGTVARIRRTVEREVIAVERLLEASPRGPTRTAAAERAARTLASLVRTLNELRRLEAAAADQDDDAPPRDIDAFRAELARRLERLAAGED